MISSIWELKLLPWHLPYTASSCQGAFFIWDHTFLNWIKFLKFKEYVLLLENATFSSLEVCFLFFVRVVSCLLQKFYFSRRIFTLVCGLLFLHLSPLGVFMIFTADPWFSLPGLAWRNLELQEWREIHHDYLSCHEAVTFTQSCKVVDKPQSQRVPEPICPAPSTLLQSKEDQQVHVRSSLKLPHCTVRVHRSPRATFYPGSLVLWLLLPVHHCCCMAISSASAVSSWTPTNERSCMHPPDPLYHPAPKMLCLR